jgi:membrane-associated phospholipid phosphatase
LELIETVGRPGSGSAAGSRGGSKVWTTFYLACILSCGSWKGFSQTTAGTDKNQSSPTQSEIDGTQPEDFRSGPVTLKRLSKNLVDDQKNFWTTPFRMSAAQWKWSIPLVFAGAALVASDTAIENHVPSDSSTVKRAVSASNYGLAAFAGTSGGLFLWGKIAHNDQQRETGLLGGEAGIDAFLDTEVLAYVLGRNRPFSHNQGRFFQGGDSFPSQHAAISWAIASVFAHEYPGPLTQLLSYGAAGGVTAARFAGQKHFASDLLIGSALGWYEGRQVYRSHSHYSDADYARFGTFSKSEKNEGGPEPGDMGSPNVPLDSWVYPAMERLIALGYIDSADLGLRPWTRMECARLLAEETKVRIDDQSAGDGAPVKIYAALVQEFSEENSRLEGNSNLGIDLDSVYTRFTGIWGAPLQDGLHFGQTIINDFGRPYASGFNNVTGFTSHAVAGPFFYEARIEYQHAPGYAAISQDARNVILSVDGLPSAPPGTPIGSVNKLDLLEGYVGLQLANWQLTLGKQALWWGEDESGPMLSSTNAAPILMLQINRAKPFFLPSIFKVIGPIRATYFLGRTSGYHWVFSSNAGFAGSWTKPLSDQPFIVGEKLSFKPTSNLELGFAVTALAGGTGVPFTVHKLIQASFSAGNGSPGTSQDPGDHRGAFDIAYRLPKLRDWLTIYADAFTDDQSNPWVAWNKAAVTSGFYMPKLPKISKLDFRVEGAYTDLPWGTPVVHLPGFFYFNDRFKSGYTNDGNLIGSWIGREGQGAEAWTNYWFTPKTKLQFNFRHQKVSRQFIPDGGTLTDFAVRGDFWMRTNFAVSAWIQYERWLFPVIEPGAVRDTTAAMEFVFAPQKLFRRAATNTTGNQP